MAGTTSSILGQPSDHLRRWLRTVTENTMSAPEPARVDFPSAGLTVAAYRWDPAGAPRAIVQITHGMGEHALRYADLAQALNARDMVVYAQDHRGHGATAKSVAELGQIGEQGWTELIGDIGRLMARARQEHPDVPLVLLGHSMGSFAVQQYLLQHGEEVSAAVLTGTGSSGSMGTYLSRC